MERFPSLINSLKSSYEAGKSNAELLNLLEEMRIELTGGLPLHNEAVSRVAVWLPAGYRPLTADNLLQAAPAAIPDSNEAVMAGENGHSFSRGMHPMIAEPQPPQSEKVLVQPIGVPRPPLVTQAEPEEVEPITEASPQTAVTPDTLLPGGFLPNPTGPAEHFLKNNFMAEVPVEHDEGPVVIELKLEEEMPEVLPAEEPVVEQPFTIPQGFLLPGGVQEMQAVAKPRELHEILANRVVAKPEPTEAVRQPAVLADKLSGGKINDLRKAIAINDRFRFIQSLFRGDDSLFERSVKTINNFSILPEAQYWIQRELVIKLGWNEEDELVQLFYQLVSRRFL